MNSRVLLSLLTAGSFGCGFVAVRWWPVAAVGPAAAAGAPAASVPVPPPRPPGSELARLSAIRKRAASLTPDEAHAVMEALQPPVPDSESAWLSEVLRRWAENDPGAALAWLRRNATTGQLPHDWDVIVLTPLARTDLAAAFSAGQSIGMSARRKGAGYLLAAAAEHDPAGAMAFTQQHRWLAPYSGMAFHRWLELDPAAACAWFRDQNDQTAWPIREMISDLADIAPERVQEMVAALPDKSAAKEIAAEAMAAIEVKRDPAGALAKFPALDESGRRQLLAPLANWLAASGTPDEAIRVLSLCYDAGNIERFLGALGDRLRGDEDRLLLFARDDGFSKSDRAVLLRYADGTRLEHADEFMSLLDYQTPGLWTQCLASDPDETLPRLRRMVADGTVDDSLLFRITSELEGRSPETIEPFILALPADRQATLRAFMDVRSAFHGEFADLTAFAGLPDSSQREAILRSLCAEGSAPSAEYSLAFLRQLPAEQRMDALNSMSLVEGAGEAIAPLVEEAVRTGGDAAAASVPLVASAFSDSAAALAWLARLPAGESVAAATADAFSRFVEANPVEASAWLAAQPPDSSRHDEMAGALVSRITSTDPERAWQWAGSIHDEQSRAAAQAAVLSRWRVLDSESAARVAGSAE